MYIHSQIDNIPYLTKDINQTITRIENIDVSDYTLKSKITELIRNCNNRIAPRQNELSNIISSIVDKEKSRKDFAFSQPSDKELEKFESLGKKSFRDSMVKDVEFSQQILDAREEELRNIQKVSAQVKDMAVAMNLQVQEQGKALSNFFYKYL